MHSSANGVLSAEEAAELQRVEAAGAVSVKIYEGGIFSEPEFVRYGVLQRLEIRRLLVCQGLSRHGGDMTFAFSAAQQRIAA